MRASLQYYKLMRQRRLYARKLARAATRIRPRKQRRLSKARDVYGTLRV